MRSWLAAGGESFEARSIDQEDVKPSVVIVIVERHAAAGGLEQIFVLVLAAVNCLHVEAGFAADIGERGPNRVVSGGGILRLREKARSRPYKRKNITQR